MQLKERIQNKPEWALAALEVFESMCRKHPRFLELNATEVSVLRDIYGDFKDNGWVNANQTRYVCDRLARLAAKLERFPLKRAQVRPYKKGWRRVDSELTTEYIDGRVLRVRYPSKARPDVDALIKKMSGVKREGDGAYQVRQNYFVVKDLMRAGFSVDDDTTEWVETLEAKPVPVTLRQVRGEPRPFQQKGVDFGVAKGGRMLLADEQGLGKSMQGAIIAHMLGSKRPVLLVCPASLKINWQREIATWTPMSTEVIGGIKPDPKWEPTADVTIINYDVLYVWEKILEGRFPLIIFDEIQYLLRTGTKRSKAVETITGRRKRSRHKKAAVLGLSGTPIEGLIVELYFIISIIEPDLFGTKDEFCRQFAPDHLGRFPKKLTAQEKQEYALKLHKFLTSTIMLRRLKEDVAPELPRKQKMVVPLEIDNLAEYRRAEADFIRWLKEVDPTKNVDKKSAGLQKVKYLKRLAYKGKAKAVRAWLEDYMEREKKVVVFAWHRDVISDLLAFFGPGGVKVDGSVNGVPRQKVVDAFQQNPKIRGFVGQLKAAGTGLTLTAANATVTVELWWKDQAHAQAEDRVHRIGQKADSVFAYYLVAAGTIEELIIKQLDEQRVINTAVMDGKVVEEKDMLGEIFKHYRKRRID